MVTTLLDPQATLSLDRESARLAPGHSIRITGNLFSNVPASTRYRLWTFAKQDEQAVSAAQLGVAVSPRWTDMLDQPYSDDIRIEAMDGGGGNFRGRRRRLQLLQRARDALQQRRGGAGAGDCQGGDSYRRADRGGCHAWRRCISECWRSRRGCGRNQRARRWEYGVCHAAH